MRPVLKCLLFTCCIFFCFESSAQKPLHDPSKDSGNLRFCSNDDIFQKLRLNTNFRQLEEKMNRQILRAGRQLDDDTITLPVVIHIINPDPYSVTDSQVVVGINDLNDAFGKAGVYSASLGVDTKIRFCIAKTDPDSGITTGITRTTSYFGDDLNRDNEDDRLKNLIQWDPSQYINIWLISNINSESYASYSCGVWTRFGVSGYATMPMGADSLDGVVTTRFGTLLTHEMGHYLGLYHTFEGSCTNNNCEVDGDRVCDTPPDGSLWLSPGGCANPSNSCNTDTLSNFSDSSFFSDVPDQVSNFMDYGNDACMNQFTQGQADRMKAIIRTQRSGLLINKCAPPCTANIIASFTRDTAYTSIGESVSFTNTSTGATRFTWLVDDVVTATTANFRFTFNAAGKYKISLKAYNADAACFGAYTSFVLVNCGVSARFYTDKKTIASKLPLYPDSIVFTNTSFRGQSFQWLIGNDQGMTEQVVSTGRDLIYTFAVPASYTIRLVASNGSCVDTSNSYNVLVQDPSPDGAPVLISAYCYQQTRLRVNVCVDNFGFAPLPKNTPVTFYDADPRLPGARKLSPTLYLPDETAGRCRYCFYDHIIDVPYAGLNELYAVFNDSGNTAPLVLPNRSLQETNYANNVAVIRNFRYQVSITPAAATLLPGDTLQLSAQASPAVFPASTYLWSPATRLSCTTCNNPALYADSDRVKRVIATSQYGCIDTAYITIKVPPANDYTVKMNSVTCASANFMDVNFTLYNDFFRGVIPEDLRVSFYNGDPRTGDALLLGPVFSVPDTVFALESTFNTRIRIMPEGTLFAVVNDSAISLPVVLPNTSKPEKTYTNNFHSIAYTPVKTLIDTSICEGSAYFGYKLPGTYTDTLRGYNGCDSIRTVRLEVRPVFATNMLIAICAGENYAGYTETGVYTDVYTAVNGCDSSRTLLLTVRPVFNTQVDTVICEGQNYAGYTTSGTYTDRLTAINGCDSTRTLTLTVNPVKSVTIDPEICEGESFLAGGRMQTRSGTYFDTLKTYLGCDSIKTTNLTVHPNPRPNLGEDRGICIGGTHTLQPGDFSTYRWQDGSTEAMLTTRILGSYYVEVTNEYGCKAADTIVLDKVLPLPAGFLPRDTSLCLGNQLRIDVPGYRDYLWSNGSTSNFINIVTDGVYNLQVTDPFYCVGTDSIRISFITDCIIIEIPNAFSPNGDGLNETFKPFIPVPVTDYTMQIYNRLGQLVFETNNPSAGWNGNYKGRAQDPAAFVYYITLKALDRQTIKRRGSLMLIR